ncbi:hypothetical protein [Flavihumibacter fluvii]|uniref:hypothetical protein n=1 Tax=Flavihumibacter fluvii TaxID=2838157 RepID=UPI001BDEFB80|nr:hypothetical protein [Flavihumibacter fluvii]ULQ52347.1 hypothetical protein KJS93_19860 [Flavihumibacter fluvii]
MHIIRLVLCLFSFTITGICFAQNAESTFPASWQGKWKGTLDWYQGPVKRQSVDMELHILPTDSADQYSWRLIYGKQQQDNRPYILRPYDKSKGHWLIDELNSIILDQFLIGDRFCGSFSVGGNTILNTYALSGDSLVVEFYNSQEKAIAITGGRDTTIPKVKSYGIRSFQRAVLKRSDH